VEGDPAINFQARLDPDVGDIRNVDLGVLIKAFVCQIAKAEVSQFNVPAKKFQGKLTAQDGCLLPRDGAQGHGS
jgi:hypothetical protein